MRKRLLVLAVGVAAAAGSLGLGWGGPSPAGIAMTCAADPPIDYACDVGFYLVGSVCQGHLPTKPPTPPLIGLNAAPPQDLCPPLG